MVKESHQDVSLTSIAMLQERFRQLQRMKELRQERELLRTLSDGNNSINHYDQQQRQTTSSSSFPCHQYMKKSQSQSQCVPQCQLSLSLWPDHSSSQNKHPRSRELPMIAEGQSDLAKKWLTRELLCTSPLKLERCGASDIDTSLRL